MQRQRDGEGGHEVEEAFADVGGCRLFYRRLGSGPPIVLIHGGMVLDGSNFLPHVAPLADEMTVIIYDQAGRGLSEEREDLTGISIFSDVDDLEGLREALGYERWVVAGHSWGGVLAGLYAERYPGSVASLVMIAPVGAHYPAWQRPWIENTLAMLPEEDRREFDAVLGDKGLRSRDAEEYFTRYFTSIHKAWFGDQSWAKRVPVHKVRARTGGAVWDSLRGYDFRDLFKRIGARTLIVHGTRDAIPLSSTEEIRDLIPGARLEVFDGAGHYPFIEQRDRFVSLVRGFISAGDGGGR